MQLKSLKEIIEKDKKYVIHGWAYNPVVMVEGKGCIIKDLTGKEYLDFFSGCAGPMGVGYGREKIAEAVRKQASFPHAFFGHVNIPRVELCEKLAKITPPKLTKMYVGCSGGDAIEVALKGAMKFTKKREVISLFNAYHGTTIALQGLMQPRLREGLPIMPGFRQIPPAYCYRCFFGQDYPDCDLECARFLETTIRYSSYNEVAAFLLEPIQGQGGHVYPLNKEYSKIVREICDKYGVLIVSDEIQTGIGRTGKMWGCEYIGLKPDIMVLGKGIGGGFPISIAAFREDVATEIFKEEDPTSWWQALTHSGVPIVCAAASAVVDIVVEEDFLGKAARMEKFMAPKLQAMKEKHKLIGDVRGPGLFPAVELVKDRKTKEKATDEAFKAIKMCFERGVIFGLSLQPGIGNVIKMKPPFVVTEKDAVKAFGVLDEVLTELEKGM